MGEGSVERRTLSRDRGRFELRPYYLGVEEDLLRAATESRQALSEWMSWMHPGYSMRDVESWVEIAIAAWDAGSAYEFVIYDLEEERAIGSCGLSNINRIDLVANLGYWVSSSRSGVGAATAAAKLIWAFGIGTAGLNRLEIVVAVGNAASRRVAEKTGAIDEGVQRSRLRVGEVVHDAHMFACLRS